MHHSSPSAITYPSSLSPTTHLTAPPSPAPTTQLHDLHLPYSPQPYYTPHSPTTSTRSTPPSPTTHHTAPPPAPALLHPALLPTTLLHHLHTTYPTQPYDTPHCPTTCTCPTRPSPTTDLTAPPPAHDLLHPALLPTSLPHHLHTTYPTTQLSILDPPTLPMCTLLPIHSCALTGYTYYPTHRTHVPHSPPPCPSPHRCTMPPLYPIGSTTQPYLGHLYPPFSSATFIRLIRPIGLIGPTPTQARTGQVVGVIGLIGAIGLIPP